MIVNLRRTVMEILFNEREDKMTMCVWGDGSGANHISVMSQNTYLNQMPIWKVEFQIRTKNELMIQSNWGNMWRLQCASVTIVLITDIKWTWTEEVAE